MLAAEGIIFGIASGLLYTYGLYLSFSLSCPLYFSFSLQGCIPIVAYAHGRTCAYMRACVCVLHMYVGEYTYDRVHALARSCALATVAARNFGSIIERSGDRKIPALFRTRPPRWGEPNSHWLGRLVILARRWYERG